LETIESTVSRINEMNTQIASAAEEQGSVAEEINRNVVTISEVAEQSTTGARQIIKTSSNLNEMVQALQKMASRFRL